MTNSSENPTPADNQQGRINSVGVDPYAVSHLSFLQTGPTMSKQAFERVAEQRHETQQLLDFMNGR